VLPPESLVMLQSYAWPGNVRELKNFIERAVLVAPGGELLPEHFPVQRIASALPLHRIGPESAPPPSAPRTVPDERERILATLAECGGNQSRAAKALGISRTTLVARLSDYGVPRPRKP
jgi:DNA-binding NtrC family response regulator